MNRMNSGSTISSPAATSASAKNAPTAKRCGQSQREVLAQVLAALRRGGARRCGRLGRGSLLGIETALAVGGDEVTIESARRAQVRHGRRPGLHYSE